MNQHSKFLKYLRGVSEERIAEAEALLSVHFPPLFRRCLLTYGELTFRNTEFLGLRAKDSFPNFDDLIKHTLNLRKHCKLPNSILPIMESGSTAYEFGLQMDNLNDMGEPPAIVFFVSHDISQSPLEIEAEDFGTFLLNRVNIELERNSD